jgi:CTP synthase
MTTRRDGPVRHLFITGGVVSSLGKGIASGSIALLLKSMGWKVRIQKLDPYLNVDPGTMNPFQHGEVFVTEDGAETDLDLGHYERFLGTPCSRLSTVTSGRIYQTVLHNERAGKYNGGTVQVIPHVTDEIKRTCHAIAEDCDVVIHEVGGTVGDIEGLPFMEAARQFRHDVGSQYVAFVHLVYVPFIRAAGEIKTKPAQHSVQKLREIGVLPDFLLCRADKALGKDVKDKLALFCNVDKANVIDLPDVPVSVYEVPQVLVKQDLAAALCRRLALPVREPDLHAWDLMVNHIRKPKDKITVALVGKYINHQDAYKSVTEAIDHAAYAHLLKADIVRLESEQLEKDGEAWEKLRGCDAVVVPGGFGKRGFEGKLKAIRHCRETGTPYLGLCLGMQAACIEFARGVLNLERANSLEMDEKTPHPIIVPMDSQKDLIAASQLGGTMRLGSYPCTLVKKTSRTSKLYGGAEVVPERHRHRYEFNNAYRAQFEAAGLQFTGLYMPDPAHPERSLVEIVELKGHPFFLATQAHPEFKSTPVTPHPLFKGLLGAAWKRRTRGAAGADSEMGLPAVEG